MFRLFALLVLMAVIAVSTVSSQYVYTSGYAAYPAYTYGYGVPAYGGVAYLKK
ncbi:unnamed protein product [Orchesella dallaii]|uniref:Uncharacterized protein n=1 Tax=Orchesella dallaii TaxID=48710 RepID=A0ABP1S2K8_9HEXA